ncbi:hypothetical protein ACN9JY_03260 [Aliarcobacter butzleri]|uniref:hypothetical protein n=1 Tax=Aliarcobacter butzleri TaxID=28197 RepID=UPI003B22369B
MTQEDIFRFNIEHVKNSIPGIDKTVGATKKELAIFFNTSISSINRLMLSGNGLPKYLKKGNSKKSKVYFPLVNIALFLSEDLDKNKKIRK